MAKMVAWLVYAISVGLVAARSSGPPAEASTCVNLIPGSVSPHVLQSGNGTYDITVSNLIVSSTSPGYFEYAAGMQYTGTISAGSNVNIRGFLIQAWDPSTTRIGTFTPATAQKNLLCNPVSSAIADAATLIHSQPNTNPTVTFTWTAPSGSSGLVDFRFTIVRQQSMYFGPLSAASPDGLILEDDPTLPNNVTLPTRNPEDYRITARVPTGCQVSDCQVFAAIDTNAADNSFLDIYLEGKAKGWVAVGFTDSPNMFSADVIGCNVVNAMTMELQALDTWNPAANTRDNSRDFINNAILRNSSVTDGRIRCIINREIVTTGDQSLDLPLNNSLYLIYGYSDNQAPNQLSRHGVGPWLTPQVSSGRVNPQSGTASFASEGPVSTTQATAGAMESSMSFSLSIFVTTIIAFTKL